MGRTSESWTNEQREAARQRCIENRIWEHSTGPKTSEGKAVSKMNAYKGGFWLKVRVAIKLSNVLLRKQKESVNQLLP